MKLKLSEKDGNIILSSLGSMASGTITKTPTGYRVIGKLKDADHPFFIRNLAMTKRKALRTLKAAFFERALVNKNNLQKYP